MKKKIIILVIAIILILSCIFTLIFLNKGSKELVVKVRTNGGVPYTWQYEIENSNVVYLADQESYSTSDELLEGGPVEVKFTFKGKEEGKTTIYLRYVSIVNGTIDKEEKYNVKVDKNGNIETY